jgi:hypothetical protein
MSSIRSQNHILKFCDLAATSLIIPALAYADHDDHTSSYGDYGWGDKGKTPIPHAPEANAGWVLVPFFGAVLFFSARHLFRGKVTE